MPFKEGFKTSKYDDWATPQYIFDTLNERFHFTLDVCANRNNAKCRKYFTKKQDGLKQKWTGTCWCNPPYGIEIAKWVQKAYDSSLQGTTVVCLVPSATSTRWWHNYAMKGKIEFIKGKVRFVRNGDDSSPAPFHSAIVIFQGKKRTRQAA